ncbi:MAG: homoserine dehydrogenase [Bifidobacteriaceae bacterium]|jgi:homoserine dehydrogenase|nr:homoserine dehydrogenase [Bifidobacteriaceae bacterium]
MSQSDLPAVSRSDLPTLRIALLGFGVVGSEVGRLLMTQGEDLAARTGANLELIGVAVRSLDEPQVKALKPPNPTTDAAGLISQADIVVELMGGIEPARTFMLKAIEKGAAVVTANKALLAAHGPTLYEAAADAGVDLFYEAAVGGAIPIVRGVRVSLAGDKVTRILGIVNGTTNYVLDQMTREHLAFSDAVSQAQRLGFAEADPTADVEGFDAASKAAILASLAFHTRVSIDEVHREGITAVTQADIEAAAEGGYVIKLLAIVERVPDGSGSDIGVVARVHPALVPLDHPLASVHGAFNAVFTESQAAGPLMFYGQGAGGVPTSSAVVGDIVAAARHRLAGQTGPGESAYTGLKAMPIAVAHTRYQVRLVVADRPGVLASVATVFAAHRVSIDEVRQTPRPTPEPFDGPTTLANLVIVTHNAAEADLSATVADLGELDAVQAVAGVIRVEGV